MHELEIIDGVAQFFSARDIPWHRLGKLAKHALTAPEALKEAGLDWPVFKSDEPVTVPVLTPNGVTTVLCPDRFMVYRDHPVLGLGGLGVVGPVWEPVQNVDAFHFTQLLTDEFGAVFETAGSMNDGRRVFLSMKLPTTMQLAGGDDTIDWYVMAYNTHDGTTSFTIAITPIRPVCSNTVKAALAAAKSVYKIRHTKSATSQIQEAREALGLGFGDANGGIARYMAEFEKEANALLSVPMSIPDFSDFVKVLVPDPEANKYGEVGLRAETNVRRTRDEMAAIFASPTHDNVANTRWAGWNAVVEWADWGKTIRGIDDGGVKRAQRIMDGADDKLKQEAFALLRS